MPLRQVNHEILCETGSILLTCLMIPYDPHVLELHIVIAFQFL